VLHHFWSTGGALKVDRLWVEYFLDGETTPSISFQPSQMCGLAAAFLPEFNNKTGHTDLYHAGAMCGRNSAVGGFFNTFPIPFQKSALVTVRSDCIVPYLTLAKSTRLPILLCNFFNLAGAPKRTVGYLRCSAMFHCQGRICCLSRPNSSKSRPWQHLESPKWSKSYCSFGKVENPGTNVDFAFFKIVW
jgi:hypothetical protein